MCMLFFSSFHMVCLWEQHGFLGSYANLILQSNLFFLITLEFINLLFFLTFILYWGYSQLSNNVVTISVKQQRDSAIPNPIY